MVSSDFLFCTTGQSEQISGALAGERRDEYEGCSYEGKKYSFPLCTTQKVRHKNAGLYFVSKSAN